MSENLIGVEELLRPKTRADCVDGPRPCPWVGCVHHLAIRVTQHGSIKSNRGLGTLPQVLNVRKADRVQPVVEEYTEAIAEDVMDMEMTCALDCWEGMTAIDAGAVNGLSSAKAAMKESNDAEHAYRAAWTEMYGEPPELP